MSEVLVEIEYPKVETVTNPKQALDWAVIIGACILEDVVDLELLRTVSGEIWPQGDDSEFYDVDRAGNTGRLISSVPILGEIAEAMTKRGLPELNTAGMLHFNVGDTTPTHIDNSAGRVVGVSLLIPVRHGADFRAYPDGVFAEVVPNSPSPFRNIERIRPGLAQPTRYGPGDVLLLRQEFEERSPVAHDSVSVTSGIQEEVNMPRQLISLECVVSS